MSEGISYLNAWQITYSKNYTITSSERLLANVPFVSKEVSNIALMCYAPSDLALVTLTLKYSSHVIVKYALFSYFKIKFLCFL